MRANGLSEFVLGLISSCPAGPFAQHALESHGARPPGLLPVVNRAKCTSSSVVTLQDVLDSYGVALQDSPAKGVSHTDASMPLQGSSHIWWTSSTPIRLLLRNVQETSLVCDAIDRFTRFCTVVQATYPSPHTSAILSIAAIL